MRANKVYNNNAAAVIYPDGREAIWVGTGIGFGRRPGDLLDRNKVQKIYYIQDAQQTRFLQLLKDARPEALNAAEEILDHARSQGLDLKDQLILSLTDHICFAMERAEQGTQLPYLMQSETRMLYPREFEIGLWALERIRELCHADLPEYEAGYIALHLASAAMNSDEDVYNGLRLVTGALEIIKDTYGIELAPDDFDTVRLTTHLKFLAQRILSRAQWNDDDMGGLYQMLLLLHKKNQECINRLTDYIRIHYSYELNHQEKLYLLVHLSKLLKK